MATNDSCRGSSGRLDCSRHSASCRVEPAGPVVLVQPGIKRLPEGLVVKDQLQLPVGLGNLFSSTSTNKQDLTATAATTTVILLPTTTTAEGPKQDLQLPAGHQDTLVPAVDHAKAGAHRPRATVRAVRRAATSGGRTARPG